MNTTFKKYILALITTAFSLSSFARLGGNVPLDPIIRARLEPSSSYFYVILPIFIVALAIVYFIYWKCSLMQKSSNKIFSIMSLLIPAVSGIILFWGYPIMYRKFFKVYSDLGVDARSLLNCDLPFLMNGKIFHGIILILTWFFVQPIVLQVLFKRENNRFTNVPFLLFFFCYSGWFVFALFYPLMFIY